MTDLPAPLMPATVDLRDFQFMPIDVRRLLTSETWMLGDGEERAAAMTLWLESWHQVPAGSLPNNDRMLAHLAQCPRWSKVKRHALRGWVECADGRLYHPVVCEKALEAWLSKLSERLGAAEGNAKRWGTGFDPAPYIAEIREAAEKLRALNPHSKALAKKQLTKAVKSSPPESGGESGSESPPESGDDSREDRKRQYKGQGQGQGYISLSHTHTRACAREDSTTPPNPAHHHGVIDCGTNLTRSPEEVHGPLDAWRDVQGINAEAFVRWIVHVESSGRPMTAAMRIGQAKRLAGQGSAAEQVEVVEFCIAQGYRSLIPLVDVRARTQGLTRAATATPARTYRRAPTTEELEAREAAHAGK